MAREFSSEELALRTFVVAVAAVVAFIAVVFLFIL